MARKEFHITLNDKQHTITVNHKFFSSERKIWINQKLEHDSKVLLDMGTVHDFPTGNDLVTVCIYPNPYLTYTIDLFINNVSQVTGHTVEDIPRQVAPWVYVFVLIHIIMFFIFPIDSEAFGTGVMGASISGGIGGGIVGLTATYCAITTKNPYFGTPIKILICIITTAITYGILSNLDLVLG